MRASPFKANKTQKEAAHEYIMEDLTAERSTKHESSVTLHKLVVFDAGDNVFDGQSMKLFTSPHSSLQKGPAGMATYVDTSSDINDTCINPDMDSRYLHIL